MDDDKKDILDDKIKIGFMDEDDLKDLEQARLDYFSKYSDSQLDEIYEADINARGVIDKIRKARNRNQI